MSTKLESKDIEQLLAEADELIRKINSDVIWNLKEEHRIQLEIHSSKLNKIKSEVEGGIENKKTSKTSNSAEGVHEAILEIIKAVKELATFVS